MDQAHEVQHVSIAGAIMRLRVDGRDHEVDLARASSRLAEATPKQRKNFEISPAGYGIHWPDLDEDLSIDGLIGIPHSPPLAQTEA